MGSLVRPSYAEHHGDGNRSKRFNNVYCHKHSLITGSGSGLGTGSLESAWETVQLAFAQRSLIQTVSDLYLEGSWLKP